MNMFLARLGSAFSGNHSMSADVPEGILSAKTQCEHTSYRGSVYNHGLLYAAAETGTYHRGGLSDVRTAQVPLE